MIVVSPETISSFAASVEHADDRDAYSEAFWDRIENENADIMEYFLAYVEALESDEQRAYYLDGVFTTYEFIRRQIEAEQMERDML